MKQDDRGSQTFDWRIWHWANVYIPFFDHCSFPKRFLVAIQLQAKTRWDLFFVMWECAKISKDRPRDHRLPGSIGLETGCWSIQPTAAACPNSMYVEPCLLHFGMKQGSYLASLSWEQDVRGVAGSLGLISRGHFPQDFDVQDSHARCKMQDASDRWLLEDSLSLAYLTKDGMLQQRKHVLVGLSMLAQLTQGFPLPKFSAFLP